MKQKFNANRSWIKCVATFDGRSSVSAPVGVHAFWRSFHTPNYPCSRPIEQDYLFELNISHQQLRCNGKLFGKQTTDFERFSVFQLFCTLSPLWLIDSMVLTPSYADSLLQYIQSLIYQCYWSVIVHTTRSERSWEKFLYMYYLDWICLFKRVYLLYFHYQFARYSNACISDRDTHMTGNFLGIDEKWFCRRCIKNETKIWGAYKKRNSWHIGNETFAALLVRNNSAYCL